MKDKWYQVTIKFVGGLLEGLTRTECRKNFTLKVGDRVMRPVCGTSPYEVTKVEFIGEFNLYETPVR